MLRWIKSRLDPYRKPDDSMQWFAILLAFFFLMRIGEYAHSGYWDLRKVVLPTSLQFRNKGAIVADPREADEISLHFRSSKADQEGVGATRSHYRHDGDLCLLQAAGWFYTHFAHRFRSERDAPLFRWSDGSPLTREQVQAVLELSLIHI